MYARVHTHASIIMSISINQYFYMISKNYYRRIRRWAKSSKQISYVVYFLYVYIKLGLVWMPPNSNITYSGIINCCCWIFHFYYYKMQFICEEDFLDDRWICACEDAKKLNWCCLGQGIKNKYTYNKKKLYGHWAGGIKRKQFK